SKATVNTIRADSVSYDKNIVRVWQIASLQSSSRGSSSGGSGSSYSSARNYSTPAYTFNTSSGTTSGRTSAASNYFGNNVYNFGTPATLTVATPVTYSDDYSFDEFDSVADFVSYRLTRNYFELRFAPTWLDEDFMSVDFEDFFGMRNATEDELTID
ncbi:MAG: hypothetical protein IJP68_02305, partial [Selenomonadaceae bacterium]|nr:hypothetical protein [Selenomonadaceae bacterium]